MFRKLTHALVLLSMSLSSTLGHADDVALFSVLKPGPNTAIIEFDGTASEEDIQLTEDVMKTETYEEEYQDTCYRQVPDGTERKCETRYRTEPKCGNETVCRDEQQCSNEYVCRDAYRCTTKQDCGYEYECRPETVCNTERECRVEPRCRTVQDCRNERVCKEDRDCRIVNGERVCETRTVCNDVPVCTSRQECTNERVCDERPVCRTENRCSNEYRCRDRQECGTVQECGYETQCRTVPRCGTEYVCHDIQVPYQHCYDAPKYRSEPYTCTKTRTKTREVLDYKHNANVKILFKPNGNVSGAIDKFRVWTINGKIKFELIERKSQLAYFFKVESKMDQITLKEKVTTAVITLGVVNRDDVLNAVVLKDLKADKKQITFVRSDISSLVNFKPAIHLKVVKTAGKNPRALINRELLPSEYTVDRAGTGVTVLSKSLKLDKAMKERGEFEVSVILKLNLNADQEWIAGTVADLFKEIKTNYKK